MRASIPVAARGDTRSARRPRPRAAIGGSADLAAGAVPERAAGTDRARFTGAAGAELLDGALGRFAGVRFVVRAGMRWLPVPAGPRGPAACMTGRLGRRAPAFKAVGEEQARRETHAGQLSPPAASPLNTSSIGLGMPT